MENKWLMFVCLVLPGVHCQHQVQIGQVYRFKSKNYPNRLLRHRNYDVWIDESNIHASLYEKDSSFIIVPGLAGKGISFRSLNYPNRYLRHRRWYCYIDEGNESDLFKEDASFVPVNGLSLGGQDYVSFESVNYPGFYIRHSGITGYRVQVRKDDGSDLFKEDATWNILLARSTKLTVCEDATNNRMQLSCPYNNEEVFIIAATFGRTANNVCGGGGGGVTNCRAPVSEVEVKKRCNGKKRCTLEASKSIFGDPCADVSKYLQVTYTCINAVVPTTLRACEGSPNDKVKISCHNENERIHITSADYGRRKTTICPQGANDFTKCIQFLAEGRARQLCDGRRECVLKATNSMFGDPCPGISKYLVVSYICEYSARPIKLHVCEDAYNNTVTLSCPSKNKEIRILDAFYGRRSTNICRKDGRRVVTKCEGLVTAEGLVKESCEGKNRCSLEVSSQVFGDSCKGVSKYLEVSYECVRGGTKSCLRECDDSARGVVCGSDGKTYRNQCLFKNRKCDEKTLQVLHEGECRELISSQSFHMLPSNTSATFMGKNAGLPIQKGVGKMSILPGTDIIEWENKMAEPGPFQWLGWRSKGFAGRTLRISFWIKFVKRVPSLGDAVVKIYGVEYSDVMEKCQDEDRWCYVETTVNCRNYGDDDHVTLNFDKIGLPQKIQVKKMKVEVEERVSNTYYATSSPLTKIMGVRSSFPQTKGVGRMYAGGVIDNKFDSNDVFTWENTQGKAGTFQSIGWKGHVFANQMLKISFWIKFVNKVPPRSDGFGIKIYGVVYNEFVQYCHVANTWCYVEKTVKSRDTGMGDHVGLVFDSIAEKQLVHVGKLKVELLASVRDVHNLLPSTHRKIMKNSNDFPHTAGVGKMYVGNVADTKYQPNDIITWQNTAGTSGPLQWLGWQDQIFSNEMLRISFWVLFVTSVPRGEANEVLQEYGGFGVKVYGVVYNEFVKNCVADIWCYVEELIKCKKSGDGNRVLLIFDSIARTQTVRLAKFNVDIV